MIFCYTHRLVSCPVVIREASSGSRQEHMQRPTPRHCVKRKCKLQVSIGSLSPRAQKSPWKRGRKDRRNQWKWRILGEHGPLNHLSKVNKGSQRLKGQLQSLHGSVLGPLHMVFCGTPNSESGYISDSFAYSWDFFFSTYWVALPSLNITAFCLVLFCLVQLCLAVLY